MDTLYMVVVPVTWIEKMLLPEENSVDIAMHNTQRHFSVIQQKEEKNKNHTNSSLNIFLFS